MIRNTIVTAAGLALVATLASAPAYAQRDRVFVASYGSDSNPCTFGSPCKTFQNAVNVVAAGGEVTAIDSAGFGTITIQHSVTITSPNGVEAGIAAPANGNAAITINAGSGDIIVLNGLTLDGDNVNDSTGIIFNSGGSLKIRNCVVRNFGAGISFAPNSTGQSQLFVSNTVVSDNGGDGIAIASSGSGTTTGVLDHVELESNGDFGLISETSTQTVNITVSDSSVTNGGDGIYADGTASITVRNSTIANNNLYGLEANTGGTVRVTRSTITNNGNGWKVFNSGVVLSYGDNNIDGNGAANSEPPNPLSYH